MKALIINVYKNASGYDCTNNGISSKYQSLLLVCDEGNIEIDENNLPENLVKIVVGYKGMLHVEPVARPSGVGWMAGGNIANTCDSRFRRLSPYPLSIHDRQETQEEYNSYN